MIKYILFLLLLVVPVQAQQVSNPVAGPASSTIGNLSVWGDVKGNSLGDSGLGLVQNPIPVPPALGAAGLPALIGLNTPAGIGFRKQVATTDDGNNVLIVRDATFTGGVFGHINTALNTTCHAGPGILSFEWCGLFYMDNHATLADNSENAGLYIKSAKRTTGKTWGLTIELDDYNTTASATGQSVTLELDHSANGPDLGNNRGILHLVANKLEATGAMPNVAFGLKIGEAAKGTFTKGVSFEATTFTTGIDMRQGTYTSSSIWLRDDAPIAWSTNGSAKTYFDIPTQTVKTEGNSQVVGNLTVSGIYAVGSAGGVSCPAGSFNPTTAVVTAGIITHC